MVFATGFVSIFKIGLLRILKNAKIRKLTSFAGPYCNPNCKHVTTEKKLVAMTIFLIETYTIGLQT